MNLQEIKDAIAAGKRVCWSNHGYDVILDNVGQYLIKCSFNNHCIGLTHLDGVTMNGEPDEFFIAEPS